MSSHLKTLVFRTGPQTILSLDGALAPILVGAAAGIATGAAIWVMAVIRFGIPGWFWP